MRARVSATGFRTLCTKETREIISALLAEKIGKQLAACSLQLLNDVIFPSPLFLFGYLPTVSGVMFRAPTGYSRGCRLVLMLRIIRISA